MADTIYVNTARHGSLQNAIADQTQSRTPEVGIGVTRVRYSDRHPYTVVKVLSAKRIVVKADTAIRTDNRGEADNQEYRYEQNPDSEPIVLFLNKHGKWKKLGDAQGSTFLIGVREEYYDFTR